MRRPISMYVTTTLVWGAMLLAHLAVYLDEAFSALPTDEVYANSAMFQVVAFGLTRMPYWIIGLLVVLSLEFATVGRR